jgi:TetR/AcrR family transcriptional regulator
LLDAAMRAFAGHGYEATSLDALAAELGVRKQTILYYFASKELLLEAVIDRAGAELIEAVEGALVDAGPGWERVEAVVRSVFRLAGRRPDLLGLLREVTRLGPPPSTWLRARLDPFVARAAAFLDDEMASGQDAQLLLLQAYSTVIGAATEVEVLRALGAPPYEHPGRRRHAELLDFLRSALVASPSPTLRVLDTD